MTYRTIRPLKARGRTPYSPPQQWQLTSAHQSKCFRRCESLSRVIFGKSSSLKRIGEQAFFGCSMLEIVIPARVEAVGEKCFKLCSRLTSVNLGESSSLKRIGRECFAFSNLSHFRIPKIVESLGPGVFSEWFMLFQLWKSFECHISWVFIVEAHRSWCVAIHVDWQRLGFSIVLKS